MYSLMYKNFSSQPIYFYYSMSRDHFTIETLIVKKKCETNLIFVTHIIINIVGTYIQFIKFIIIITIIFILFFC